MSSPVRETMKQAGYEYVSYEPRAAAHILKDTATGNLEVWVANKNHASYAIIFKNTHLEFVRSV